MKARDKPHRGAATETGKPQHTTAPAPSPTPALDALIAAEPDLVDRIFDYCVQIVPELAARKGEIKTALRDEFGSQRTYVRRERKNKLAAEVLRLFNGRNATEVARRLQVHRATVYRLLKQPG